MPSSAAMSMTVTSGNDSGDRFPDFVPDREPNELRESLGSNNDHPPEGQRFRCQRIDGSQVLPGLFIYPSA
jgi:hypothetical protein